MKTSTEYREQFEALVAKANQEIVQSPTRYKRRLQWLALLGYGVLGLLLVLLIALAGGTLWLALTSMGLVLLLVKSKVIFVIFALMWALARSLWVSVKAPQGYELKPQHFPVLWTEVETLRKALDAPKIHSIILTPDLNAAMAQTPRLGLFGPYKNTLVLGLEMLLALSPEQARSVIAHELGHLSGNHSRFAGWIYRVRRSWLQIDRVFQTHQAWGSGLVRRFVNWYALYFSGYSFVLARDNEYSADALAASLTSAEVVASSLINTNVYDTLANQTIWQPHYKKAYFNPEPDQDVYQRLQRFYQTLDNQSPDFKRYLGEALARRTSSVDTHPALIERLKALKATGVQSTRSTHKALEWLGEQSTRVVDDFNQIWAIQNKERWAEFYHEAQAAREQLHQLKQQPYDHLAPYQQWNIAALTDRYVPDTDVLPLYERYAALYPEDYDAALARGRILLERKQSEGMPFIEHALQHPPLKVSAAELAWSYYTHQRQPELAKQWLVTLEQASDKWEAAQIERDHLSIKDHFIPSQVLAEQGDELIESILGEVASHKQVGSIWLAQKQVEHYPEYPLFIVVVKTKGYIWKKERLPQTLIELMGHKHPFFLVTTATHKALAKQVLKVAQQIY
ncbi:MAG: hypothetical protein RLZZ422_1015 [Pseudomonadota bacterium]|jgi:Zn-dependent protease with chaperone function